MIELKLISTCTALDKKTAIRCSAPAGDGDEWCGHHLRLQAKALKHYKAISLKLENQPESKVSAQDILHCPSMRALFEWLTTLRNRRNHLRKTIDSRSTHHDLYYDGGDEGHRAWINKLEKQESEADRMMLEIEARAYDLTLAQEAAQWLLDPIEADCCGPKIIREGSATRKKKIRKSSLSPSKPSNIANEEDSYDYAGKASSCQCQTCAGERYVRESDWCALISSYYLYAEVFPTRKERLFARRIIENIFRFVISRTKGLLMHAKNAGSFVTLREFLSCGNGYLNHDQLKQMCTGLRYKNGNDNTGALLTTAVIRNAIRDAEIAVTSEGLTRQGSHIYILGGAVYKDAYPGNLTKRGMEHLYRFAMCGSCVRATLATFTAYHKFHVMSQKGGPLPAWDQLDDVDDQHQLTILDRGGILHCSDDAGAPKVEVLVPTERGRRGLYVERHYRSFAYIRFPLDYTFADNLINTDDPDLVVYSWRGAGEMRCSWKGGGELQCSSKCALPHVWLARNCKASGPATPKDISSRNYVETHTIHSASSVEAWRESINEDAYPHPYILPQTTIDIIIVNTALDPTLSSLIDKVVKLLGPEAVIPASKKNGKDLHDGGYNMARAFFREGERYR